MDVKTENETHIYLKMDSKDTKVNIHLDQKVEWLVLHFEIKEVTE